MRNERDKDFFLLRPPTEKVPRIKVKNEKKMAEKKYKSGGAGGAAEGSSGGAEKNVIVANNA
jgi:hypothetical protein